jgi:hypothetical protein
MLGVGAGATVAGGRAGVVVVVVAVVGEGCEAGVRAVA